MNEYSHVSPLDTITSRIVDLRRSAGTGEAECAIGSCTDLRR